ncbi:MAG TPA: alpha/beta fold hydrolase [Mycobacterium sp.]|nr:alpha/beta fold hydrolase [Mycobacterium sp.]HUH71076.1 alpha/beta fold hydrolase [Mycobacterium sp.]
MSDTIRAQEWIDQCETLISRRGHRIAFRRRGQGPAVLMLHGFPTWSYDYAEVAIDLARDHDVITLDFLGYGASDKPNPYKYSVAESADWPRIWQPTCTWTQCVWSCMTTEASSVRSSSTEH